MKTIPGMSLIKKLDKSLNGPSTASFINGPPLASFHFNGRLSTSVTEKGCQKPKAYVPCSSYISVYFMSTMRTFKMLRRTDIVIDTSTYSTCLCRIRFVYKVNISTGFPCLMQQLGSKLSMRQL
jgi:hypothetical protein